MVRNKVCGGRALGIVVGIVALVLLLAGGVGATKFVRNNATGGDCTSIGTWNVTSKTCTLTTDLTGTIEIDSDDVTLSGNGHTITGSYTGNGIYLSERNGVTVKNTNVRNFYYGIYLYNSSNNTLSGNNASNGDGIYLFSSSNNTLSGNNASNNYDGIYLDSSSNNNLRGNNASNNGYGIILDSSSNNMLSGNNASNNGGIGIHLSSSSDNTLSGNNASNNYDGIYLSSSSNNTLSGNIASSNIVNGIYLSGSSNNIYNNYFNNTINLVINTGSNTWNTTKTSGTNIIDGPYLGGNFWANPSGTGFSQTCTDANRDGICDSPYTLDGGNIDYLPLAIAPQLCILPNGKNLDLNHDGSIGIGDAVVLINHWDAADGAADLNNDGTVGISDAVVMINNWGKSC